MRIWHPKLIPFLCRQHLLAQWREGLGCYNIITKGKKGYANHPQTKEYAEVPQSLWEVLLKTRKEMVSRGWNPKPLPRKYVRRGGEQRPWQPLDEQRTVLQSKGCVCAV